MRLWDRSRTQAVRKPDAGEPVPYKLLSVLLSYPDERLAEAEDELAAAIAALQPSRRKDALRRFWEYWQAISPGERARRYVDTFDLDGRCSLYLSFYVQGDKRQRGISLLRLKRLYAAGGLLLEGRELPDYLPVVLEFAALAPPGYGETILSELRPVLEVLRTSLREIESPYAHLLDALCLGLPRLSPLEAVRVRQIIAEGPPGEQVGLEPFAPPEIMPERGVRR